MLRTTRWSVWLILACAASYGGAQSPPLTTPEATDQAEIDLHPSTPISSVTSPPGESAASDARLDRRITIDLRDVSMLEALFSIRDLAGINLVVGNEVQGAVNAAFTDAPISQVLDTLLIPRGYGYRIVNGSVVVMRLENLGTQLPNFASKIVRLTWSDAEQLVGIIESLLSPEGRVHVIPTSNSLLIMEYRDRLPAILAQIDELEEAAREYEIARQAEAQAAQEAAQAEQSAASGATMGATSNPATSSGTASGSVASGPTIPQPPQTYVRVFTPQYVTASVLVTSLEPLLSSNGSLTAVDGEDKIVALDTQENLERIAHAITELDRPRAQVRIWARIYDCSIEDLKAVGVNFNSGVNGSAMTADGDPNHSIVLDTVTSTLAAPTNGVMTLNTINRLGTVRAIFQALESTDDSRLLADPNIVVMNHEQATVNIVTEVPYQQLTQGLNGGEIGTTSFREAGVQLTVTPHIAQDNTIAMVINPTFSLLTGFTPGDNAPIIDRREATTTVRIENLNTIVLGGLRQRTRIAEKKAIPGFGRIPYLGHLFRYRKDTTRESELLVFITPEIVTPQYRGTPREDCVGETLYHAVQASPTSPIPFGFETVIAERQAEREQLNSCKNLWAPKPIFIAPGDGACTTPSCEVIPAAPSDATLPQPQIIGGIDSQ
ncbi:MAG: hypothetical protein D6753_10285 [Planctomycetota bacterium]|nr:MAG: hypothetical protein D6753_10285 [Planctomycetota bacterium]